MITKDEGRDIAKRMTDLTGKQVDFVCVDRPRLLFQVKRKRLYKVIDIDGNETPAETTDNLFHPRSGEYVYGEVHCYPCQVDNGDLEFFIRKGLTQTRHERFE